MKISTVVTFAVLLLIGYVVGVKYPSLPYLSKIPAAI